MSGCGGSTPLTSPQHCSRGESTPTSTTALQQWSIPLTPSAAAVEHTLTPSTAAGMHTPHPQYCSHGVYPHPQYCSREAHPSPSVLQVWSTPFTPPQCCSSGAHPSFLPSVAAVEHIRGSHTHSQYCSSTAHPHP